MGEHLLEDAVLESLLTAAKLPKAGEDYDFYSSTNKEFSARCKALGERSNNLLRELANLSADDAETLSDTIASLREDALLALDESQGVSNATEKMQANVTKTLGRREQASSGSGAERRPQELFKDYPPDNSRSPFKPRLTTKPHAVVTLKESIRLETMQDIPDELARHVAALGKQKKDGFYRNPYEHEIRMACEEKAPRWLWSEDSAYPVRQRTPLSSKRPKKNEAPEPDTLERVPFAYVETEAAFEDMLSHLTAREHLAIAIDLEHHSLRSFLGITCLMQISTFERDFIVDTLVLRSSMPRLLPVFADPAVVKVLHGADYDVEWLQRDFGLYVVQLFDTGQAARVLGYDSASLAYALDRHCKVVANKVLQLADWRIRPLTAEMLKYAREDTHFLLGIFDAMRRELLRLGAQRKSDAVQKVLERSADIALKAYDKPAFDPEAYLDLFPVRDEPSAQERAVAKALFEWRDQVAREEDESVEYVLSGRGLLRIAKACPRSHDQLLKELDGIKGAPLLKIRLAELAEVITSALNSGTGATQPLRRGEKVTAESASTSIAEQSAIVNDAFYCGVNKQSGSFTLERDPSLARVRDLGVVIDIAKSKKGLLAHLREKMPSAVRISALDALIADEARAEVVSRLEAVAAMKTTVDTLLKEVEESAAKVPEVMQAKPSSLTERFSLPLPQAKRTRLDEVGKAPVVGASFQYTAELTSRAGAIPTRKQDSKDDKHGKKKQQRGQDHDQAKKPAPSRNVADAAQQPATAGEVPKGKLAKNPYLLKPQRSVASSTSYTPK